MSLSGDQWICIECGTFNLTIRTVCRDCGNVRTGAEKVVDALEAIGAITALSPAQQRTEEIASAFKQN